MSRAAQAALMQTCEDMKTSRHCLLVSDKQIPGHAGSWQESRKQHGDIKKLQHVLLSCGTGRTGSRKICQ